MIRLPILSAAVAALVLLPACKREKGDPPVFSAPVRVNDFLDAAQTDPSVVAQGDFVAVAFTDWQLPVSRVRLAVSTDGGASFGATRALDEPDFEHPLGQSDPALAITKNGRVASAWLACSRPPLLDGGHACFVRGRNLGTRAAAWAPPLLVSGGEPSLRDRPYVVAEDERVFATWTERVLEGRAQWVVATEDGPSAWARAGALRARATPISPALAAGFVEALLVDRTNPDTARWVLKRVRSRDGGLSFEELETIEFGRDLPAQEWSIGAIATDATGAGWIAVPSETGYELRYRGEAAAPFVRVGELASRDADGAALARIVRSGDGRFVAAWMETTAAGEWRVRARVLGPARTLGPAADVRPGVFVFEKGPERLPGRTLDVAADGKRVHVAWSDPSRGTSDVWLASAPLPKVVE